MGTNNRDLDFHGKAITVRSTNPNDPTVVAATVIDCQGTPSNSHIGFDFHSGEGASSLLFGLTITNGYPESPGCGATHIDTCDRLGRTCTRPLIRNYANAWKTKGMRLSLMPFVDRTFT
jgi:hypothetical protein